MLLSKNIDPKAPRRCVRDRVVKLFTVVFTMSTLKYITNEWSGVILEGKGRTDKCNVEGRSSRSLRSLKPFGLFRPAYPHPSSSFRPLVQEVLLQLPPVLLEFYPDTVRSETSQWNGLGARKAIQDTYGDSKIGQAHA